MSPYLFAKICELRDAAKVARANRDRWDDTGSESALDSFERSLDELENAIAKVVGELNTSQQPS
jgi:hypothetical protein